MVGMTIWLLSGGKNIKKCSYHKDGITRTEAKRIIRCRNKKWSILWVTLCVAIFLVATLFYLIPSDAQSFRDKAHTAENILLAMSTSGLVVFFYRIPKVRNMNLFSLEKWCLFVIGLCVAINVVLSIPESTDLIEYVMMAVTGIGTGSVALLFASFDKYIEETNENDQKWIKSCPRKKQ